MFKPFLFVLALFVGGCAGVTLTQEQYIAATSEALVLVSNQLDAQEKAGLISSEREIKLQKKILNAHGLIRGLRTDFTDVLDVCDADMNKFECTDAVLALAQEVVAENE